MVVIIMYFLIKNNFLSKIFISDDKHCFYRSPNKKLFQSSLILTKILVLFDYAYGVKQNHQQTRDNENRHAQLEQILASPFAA